MTSFDASKYVKENCLPLKLDDYSNISMRLRCIDDRSSDSDDKERPIAIPGGALGLVMDAMGACTLLRRSGKHVSLKPEEITSAVSRAIGPIMYHTDEKSVKNRGIACGGCGHCNSALNDPVKYLLTEEDVKYFLERGLSEIKESLKAFNVKPTVYRGSHAASGVMIVLGKDIDIPSVGISGERVYVYHKDYHHLLLKLIASELLALLDSHTQGIAETELESALQSSAEERLSVTLGKLAVGLPVYVVNKSAEVSVTKVE